MITELRTFVAVARLGTFAAAGDRLGLTQSAVSGQMKRLETKTGCVLFERTGRSATINAAGLRVLERAETMLALADRLADPFDPMDRSGQLRIGAIDSAHSTQIRQVLPKFAAKFPNCHQLIVPGTSLELLDRVDAQQLDLAIIVKPDFKPPPSLSWTDLLREEFVLATPSSWPEDSPANLLKTRPFLRYSRTSLGGRHVDTYLKNQQLKPKEVAELDDIATILDLVADGQGVSILPKSAAYHRQFSQVNILNMSSAGIKRGIGIIFPANPPEFTREFVQLCEDGSRKT